MACDSMSYTPFCIYRPLVVMRLLCGFLALICDTFATCTKKEKKEVHKPTNADLSLLNGRKCTGW